MRELKKLELELIPIIEKASKYVQSQFLEFGFKSFEEKERNHLVSFVDKNCEEMLVNHLARIVPDAGFLGEEGTQINSNSSGLQFIIDPLDGTTNFIHGIPVFSISVALVEKNELLVGFVYDVMQNKLYHASLNNGAFCNGIKLKIDENKQIADSLIATGFPYYEFDYMDKYIKSLKSLMEITRGVRRMGSAAIDLAYTAANKFDGFYEYNLNAWDIAAGALIAKESGNIVSDFSGGKDYLFGRQILACHPKIHEDFLKIINS